MAVEPTTPPVPAPSPDPMPGDAAVQAPPAKPAATRKAPVKAAAKAVKTEAAKATRSVKDKAVSRAHSLADQGKTAATEQLDGFSRLIDDAAGQVDEKLGAQYGDYARSASNLIADLAETLRGKEVDDIVEDARVFVKKSPVVAVGAAAALGFVIARLVKSGLDAADRAADADDDDDQLA